MKKAELMAALARECPNGVSFDPMAVRLWRRKVPLENWQIRNLQADMFQLKNGLWFSTEMISNDEGQRTLREQAKTWLIECGYFSVERLFSNFGSVLSHLTTLEDFEAFLRHLGFLVAKGGKGDHFCLQSSTSLDECLTTTSKAISKQLKEAGGTLAFNEIAVAMPHLTAEALEIVRVQFLLEVHAVDVGGVPCWCSTEAIPLPEDFSEKLTTIIDTLVELDEKVSATKLEFALNLFYRTHFRREYALLDKDTFMCICTKCYQGGNNVFPNATKSHIAANDRTVPGRRVRNPNTRFSNLGIPVGAKLVYTTDPHISCIVRDDSNHVEYAGKAWAISTLAIHLLGVSSANGFRHFSYEGEVLWDRRSRLGQVGKQDEYQAVEMSPPTKARKKPDAIIGVKGRPLAPSTWGSFKWAGTNPRVAEWARRVADGENVENIASENGFKVSNVKQYLGDRRRYFDVCAKNGILPEGGVVEMSPPTKARKKPDAIIGVKGRPLAPSTWGSFKWAGTNPRVAEWARRVADGENVENIASENGFKVSNVKQYLGDRRRYFDVCAKNGILPEGGVDV